ncbi:hypothetical protein ACCR79_10525 [Klebsiella pneumoniae]
MRDLILQLSKSSIYSTKPIDYSIESAFKFTGPDQVIVVDEKTGKPQEKVQETDDNGNPVMKNGEPVMIDDPDGFQPVILKRLPEVTIAN